MPPILTKWTGNKQQVQNRTNSSNCLFDSSCAFDEARITAYEAANGSFAKDIKESNPACSRKVAALLVQVSARHGSHGVHQYIKGFDVEWESLPAALEYGVPADNEDDLGSPICCSNT